MDPAKMKRSPQVVSIVRLGGALIPSTISGWAISMSDRLFLTSMTSLEVLGIYAVGVMVAQITDLLLNSLGQAYLPYFYEHGHSREPRTRVQIVRGTYAITVLALLVALLVTLAAPALLHLFVDSRYHAATAVIGWLSLSYALWTIGSVFQSLILAVEKNVVTTYVSVATLAVNLIGNYWLIREFGMVGAAMGNALSSFAFMAFLFAATFQFNRMPWLDRRVFSPSSYK